MDLNSWLALAGLAVAIPSTAVAIRTFRANATWTDALQRQTLDRYVGEFEALADQMAFVWANSRNQDRLDFIASDPSALKEIDWQRFYLDEPSSSGFPIKGQDLLNDSVAVLGAAIKRWNVEVKSRGHVAKEHGMFHTRLYGMQPLFNPVVLAAKRVYVLLGKVDGNRHYESRRKSFEKLQSIGLKAD